jgi:hypothetical protein
MSRPAERPASKLAFRLNTSDFSEKPPEAKAKSGNGLGLTPRDFAAQVSTRQNDYLSQKKKQSTRKRQQFSARMAHRVQ